MLVNDQQVEHYTRYIIYERPLSNKDLEYVRSLSQDIEQRILSWRFDKYYNWGLRYPNNNTQYNRINCLETNYYYSLSQRLLCDNWFYSTADVNGRDAILQRIRSIGVECLIGLVANVIDILYKGNAIESISIHGSYLYGHPSLNPDDIDLIIVLRKGAIVENNITIIEPGLRTPFRNANIDMPIPKLGISVFSKCVCNPQSNNEDVLAAASQERGAGIILFGGGMSDTPVPSSIPYSGKKFKKLTIAISCQSYFCDYTGL